MNAKNDKYENPERIAELQPRHTLQKTGFGAGMVLCDIGAGSGVFSFAAAEMIGSMVYALEKSDDMIAVLNKRISERKTCNMVVKKVAGDALPLDSHICDMAAMVTVLHEIVNTDMMLREIKRILKPKGRLMLVEFHQRETPMGPPVGRRISQEDAEEICNRNGFAATDHFSLGDNFYCMVVKSL